MKLQGVQKTNWMGIGIFVLLVLIFPLVIPTSFYITQITFVGIYVIVAIGLGLLMGYAGQISLGQAAFYGLGAYTSAVLTTTYGVSPWISLLFSILVPAILAFILGYTMSRLSGYYLAMATLAFGFIIHSVLVEWRGVTNGATGLYGVPQIPFFGITLSQGINYYYFVWFFAIVVMIIAFNIVHSRVGRALRSIHDSEIASSSMGVNTGKYKMQIFVLSSMFAGIAGWLFAHMSYSISPSSFTLEASILFLAMVVLGGSSSIWGAVIGAILIRLIGIVTQTLGEHFTFITSDFEQVLYGLLLILVIIFMPRGLVPTLSALFSKRMKTKKEVIKETETASVNFSK
ncbi:branched-chain amino acid ABC transporter permease [Niallia sp. Krafla_26]|uniref:branched-chain amino acid ABC transporter permease n=1 Tax=Niallia sp. Krafla_26 TaxID=3064703 RepID=UPI003D16E9A1